MISQPHINYSRSLILGAFKSSIVNLIKSALPGVLSSLSKQQAKESTLGQRFTFCKIWDALRPVYNWKERMEANNPQIHHLGQVECVGRGE